MQIQVHQLAGKLLATKAVFFFILVVIMYVRVKVNAP